MAVPELRARTLAELSHIEVHYLVGPASRYPDLGILLIQYAGRYRRGSAGNADAQFVCAMATAAALAFEPWGVIHDLSEMAYEWGDQLDRLFVIGPPDAIGKAGPVNSIFSTGVPSAARQSAVVVGPRCEEAVRTLLLNEGSDEPLEKIGYVFRELRLAWEFVDAQIR
jgi:hypothetical protein